jgi:hypothetical protein
MINMDGELAQLEEQPLFTARRIGVVQQETWVRILVRAISIQNLNFLLRVPVHFGQ